MSEDYEYFAGTISEGFLYKVIYSKRRSIQISVAADEEPYVLVRVPLHAGKEVILKQLSIHEKWILHRLNELKKDMQNAETEGILSEEDIVELKKKARKHIPDRVRYYAGIMGVEYNKICIRAQNTRWGSCSSKGNLNFNCLLMLTPPEVIDSVVVHELAHLKHMNHSREFYSVVHMYCPDYDKWNRWLKRNGKRLLLRKI